MALAAHGARRMTEPHFRWMVALHAGVLAGAAVEVVWLRRPLVPALAALAGAAFLGANIIRWWVIRTLGRHWNIAVVDSISLGVVTDGPFRFVRHPNYAAVFVELIALPLIHSAWITALAGGAAHVWVISKRLAVEDSVLLADANYRSAMGGKPRFVPKLLVAIATSAALLTPHTALGEPITVRHKEGLLHGFLVLTARDGSHLADGDLIQTTNGNRVTSRLVFRFDDGSHYEETTEFSQDRHFRLISDHLVEQGPSFPTPFDMTIDARHGQVSVRYTDNDGKQQKQSKHMDLPDDLANGMIPVLLKNVEPDKAPAGFGFLAPAPDPQLVRLELHPSGKDGFSTGKAARAAIHYVLKVDIGGLKGFVAGLVGKQPPNSHVWILGGGAPAFIGAEEPLYAQGPLWRIHLVGPSWPGTQ